MAVGYDATDPASIPPSTPPPDYAFGYVDGLWPSFDAMCVRFPSAIHVPISAIPGSPTALTAIFSDGEAGDYSPAESAQFSLQKIADGITPGCYCSLSSWPAYEQAHIDIGILPNHVDWWIAAYPGNGPNLYPATIGHQYADMGTYDLSVILDGYLPGRMIPDIPPPPPPPPPPKEDDMITRNTAGRGYWAARPSGATYAYDGAPFLGPAQHYLDAWGIGTPANPITGITDDGHGGFVLCADANHYPGQPALYHIDASGQYSK